MTLMISYSFLQHYWWIIIALLASFLVFLMFVQGGQTMIFGLPENESEKSMIVNALGRKWEFTFTTLVTFGGTFFASFPLFYATSFGGAYWLWTVILFCFIIQAVSYEFRSKAGNIFGKKTFDIFLFLNGSLGPFLIGIAVGTFFTGSKFILNSMNQVTWQTQWYGLEALANIRNLLLGFAVLFIARSNGLLFIINTIDNESIRKNSFKRLIFEVIPFLGFFVLFIVLLLISNGFSYDPQTGIISEENYKYFNNFLQMPPVLIVFLAGVSGVLYGIGITLFNRSIKGIWFSGAGTILTVFALFLVSGFNTTVFYPSISDIQNSLTISNASSSIFTLKTMMYFSFSIPFIFAYIWYAWRALSNTKITEEEMMSDSHKY